MNTRNTILLFAVFLIFISVNLFSQNKDVNPREGNQIHTARSGVQSQPASNRQAGACTASINCDETESGQWTSDCTSQSRDGKYAKYYEFTIENHTSVTIDLVSSEDTYLYLLDSNGNILAADDDGGYGSNSQIAYTLPLAGTYTIEATTYYSSTTGSFSVSLTCTENNCSSAITCGDQLSGTWTTACTSWNNSGSYAKYYTFTGAAYETVTIDLESAEDTYMYLVDSTGNILAQNDDGGNGLNSRITHQLPASGSYTIEATNRSYAQTGSFTVSLTCYSQSCTSSLACGDTISGDWEAGCMSLNRSGSYAKYYTFTGVAGTTVTIDLKSSLDTYLVLLDSNGNTLFTDDDGGIDANSQIIFALSESGTYTVEATTYRSGQTGSFTVDLSCVSPQIALNRSRISFGVSQYGWSSQSVFVDNSGGGQLNWTAGVDQAWLSLGTLSGTGPGEISVSVYADSLSAGTYTGTVTVADSSASNLSQTVTVYLTVYGNGRTSAPFGDFLTPEDGASVSSSVPFTGWVLDDLEVSSVQIYSGSTYIGDAVFVDGARPDLEAAYPDYPKNYQAGWGYMMLTNFLPGGGNGVYTISAIATDYEGNQTTLGTKTITVDNTNVVKPFGSIDTPTQGGVAYGTNFRHQGWVLTPLPNTIPVNGKTINVYIDSEYVGHPSYNSSRQDIAGFFPTNNNSSGAGAYMDINTTTYANGTHSIFWVVTDNGGNVDGIGSRFFTIQNSGYYRKSDTAKTAKASKADFRGTPFDTVPILTKVGFGDNPAFTPLASQDETHTVTMRETGKVQLKFQQAEIVGGYMLSGAGQIAMPIGSSIRGGVFSWIPTPGFIGDYQMQFLVKGKNGDLSRSNVVLRILPKFPLKEK